MPAKADKDKVKRPRGRPPKKQSTVGKIGNLDGFLTKENRDDHVSLEQKLREGNAGAEKLSAKSVNVNDIELISFESESEYEPEGDTTILEGDDVDVTDDEGDREFDLLKKEISLIKDKATKLKGRVSRLELEMRTEKREREKKKGGLGTGENKIRKRNRSVKGKK